jgi:hypothetical protein
MAISVNIKSGSRYPGGSSTTKNFSVTLGSVTNNSKLVVCAGHEGSTATDFPSCTWDLGVTDLDVPAPDGAAGGGPGSPSGSGANDAWAKLFTVDLPDGQSGTKTLQVETLTAITGAGGAVWWIIDGAATGPLEDIQGDSNTIGPDGSYRTTLSATLTNVASSYCGVFYFNGATGTSLTSWTDATQFIHHHLIQT